MTDSSAASRTPIHRALLSVSDKTGIVELASALVGAGVEIVSTGSTAKTIAAAGLPVSEVSEVTGFPEILDGRVKTLHPAVHAGILADLRRPSHVQQLEELQIAPFELVVVNLYPFVQTVQSGATGDAVVEQIDIGGPTLIRAAAKNHANVAVLVDPQSYPELIADLPGGTTLSERRGWASRAFAHTADYDRAISGWFRAELAEPAAEWPASIELGGQLLHSLRYGENPHQRAAVYADPLAAGLAQAEQLHGKEMSYNNYQDSDAAVRAVFDFQDPAVAVIKHANPCGIAVATPGSDDPIADAHRKAHDCDPLSAYGGVVAANRPVSLQMAQALRHIFTEVVIAPGYEPAALALLEEKKNLRILRLPEGFRREQLLFKQISGGLLVSDADNFTAPLDTLSWRLASGEAADAQTLEDLAFAWKACRSVKSNAILLAHDGASVGVGMGQVNRVDSAHLAVTRAGERAAGSVGASDAFFPFPDGLQVLIDAGVRAVVQPGGSIHDAEVIDAAQAAGLTMYFTGERHFFH
ncbi:MAG: bifunctional phosphoribosylaminoimidazolecarboxamide formyltransferase/IMP cyclohydrolase [Microbacteriaceae bacterium]|jgi:phosphoribosylaminoimidazolecarboxamide formyltransferase/IMP cyclohydrolase|nr:bifunctional phosphoribosylaminoimidazolecarboxamide formyltransferase/IMP cyclohydrolase [Microbacteriaceae bacterium]MCI1207551.1 bifunctional phosphoribosylaminoimidazolecarboxamide formyltransferase/IMP cyclohydrolase [Microbacteriaceae bacterium]